MADEVVKAIDQQTKTLSSAIEKISTERSKEEQEKTTEEIEKSGKILSKLKNFFTRPKKETAAEAEGKKDSKNHLTKLMSPLKGIKDNLVNLGKNIGGKVKVGIMAMAGAAALFALLKFLDSDTWKEWKNKLIPKLTELLTNVGKDIKSFITDIGAVWDDPNWENIKKLLGDHKGKLASIALLLAVKTFGVAGLYTGVKSIGKLIGTKLGPAALITGVAMAVKDAWDGWFLSEEWGVSKLSGAIGGMFGGTGKPASLKGMGGQALKWGLIGAGLGSFFPIVGTFIGGAVGALIGTILGYFGGEKIAQAVDGFGKWVSKTWDNLIESIKCSLLEFWSWGTGRSADDFNLGKYVSEVWGNLKTWIKGILSWAFVKDEEGDDILKKGIFSELISMALCGIKEWLGKMFKFDSTSDIVASAFNALTFLPNIVFSGVKSVGKWLAEIFGFDEAAKKIANIENFTIGDLVVKAIKAISEFLWKGDGTGLLEFSFTGGSGGITMPDFGFDFKNPFAGISDSIKKSDFFKDALSPWEWSSPLESAKGVILDAFNSIFGETAAAAFGASDSFRFGGNFSRGKPMMVGEMGPELILPSSSGTVMSTARTSQMLRAGMNRGAAGAGGGAPTSNMNNVMNKVDNNTYQTKTVNQTDPNLLAALAT